MHPILLQFGHVTIYTYGVSLAVAFLLATTLASHAANHTPSEFVFLRGDMLLNFLSVALLGGILGGRLFYVLLYLPYFIEYPQEIFAIWHGGLVWYGGFLGGLLCSWLYIRVKKRPFIEVLDQIIPFVALGHAIGRLGCFFNGCCYGTNTGAWCGVLFPGHEGPVLPIQIFESLGLLAIYLVLRRAQRPAMLQYPGCVLGLYLIGYGFLRFVLEHFRGDQVALWHGLTLQQMVSFIMLVVGMGFLLRRRQTPQVP